MIARLWSGWTTSANADVYQNLLESEVFPAIAARNVAGYRGIELLRRAVDREVEFTTIMWFDDLAAVKAFAGEDHDRAYVPEKARKVLTRFEPTSRHFQVVKPRSL